MHSHQQYLLIVIFRQFASRIRIIKLAGGFLASIYHKRTPLAFFSNRYDVIIKAPMNCNAAPGRALIQNTVVGGITLGSDAEAVEWAQKKTPEQALLDCPVMLAVARTVLQQNPTS